MKKILVKNFINLGIFILIVFSCMLFFTDSRAEPLPNLPPSEPEPNQIVIKAPGIDPYYSTAADDCEICEPQNTEHYKPFSRTTAESEARTSLDEKVEVPNAQLWPYGATVKLNITWPNGAASSCSGVLIDAQHILTAGHCVYTHNQDYCLGVPSCWAADLTAIPGYEDGESALGMTGYQEIMTWTAWTEDQDYNYDLAAVKLRYPLGASVGWLGFGFNNDDAFFSSNYFTNTSYPTITPYDGEKMYESSYAFNLVQDHQVFRTDTNYEGEDGSGFYLETDHLAVYGVYSHYLKDAVHTRITSGKFTDINVFIDGNRPKNEDLTIFDLNTGSPVYFAGQMLKAFDFYIYNLSTSDILEEKNYPIEIYISSDDQLTSEDTPIGSFEIHAEFPNRSGMRYSNPADAVIKIPNDLEGSEANGGYYYIIAKLDYKDTDITNNQTNYFQADRVWINAASNINTFIPLVTH